VIRIGLMTYRSKRELLTYLTIFAIALTGLLTLLVLIEASTTLFFAIGIPAGIIFEVSWRAWVRWGREAFPLRSAPDEP